MKENRNLANGMLFSLFSFINQGFGFILLLILAKLLPPAEYGYLGLFSTLVMVIGYFRTLSTEGFLPVSFFSEGENGLKKTISCLIFVSVIIASVLCTLLMILGKYLSTLLSLPIHILWLTIIMSFFRLYSEINLNFFRIKEKIGLYGLYSCSNAFISLVLSILLIKYFSYGWEGRAYAQCMAYCLYGLLGIIFIIKGRYITKLDFSHLKLMLLWGIPLIPHLATSFLRQGCDRYIINYSHSIEEVGLFSFALTLSNVILMLGSGFNQSNSIDIYKILGDTNLSGKEKTHLLNKQQKEMFYIYTIAALTITLFGYILVPFAFPAYQGAMNYFLILSLYAYGCCLYLLYTNFLFYYKRTKNLMYITFFAALCHLGLSLLLTKFSLYYTCIAYVITQIWVVILVKKKSEKLLEEYIL